VATIFPVLGAAKDTGQGSQSGRALRSCAHGGLTRSCPSERAGACLPFRQNHLDLCSALWGRLLFLCVRCHEQG